MGRVFASLGATVSNCEKLPPMRNQHWSLWWKECWPPWETEVPYGFEYFKFGSTLYSGLEGNLAKERVTLEQPNRKDCREGSRMYQMRHWITRGPLSSWGNHGEVTGIVAREVGVAGLRVGAKMVTEKDGSNGEIKHLTLQGTQNSELDKVFP